MGIDFALTRMVERPFQRPPAPLGNRPPRFRNTEADTLSVAVPAAPAPEAVPETDKLLSWKEGLGLFAKSYAKGFERYFEELRTKPGKALGVLGVSASLGTLMAMFSRHHRLIETGFILGTLAYPIRYATVYLPKIAQALRPDNPEPRKKREKVLRKSLEELIYQTFHMYLKPITFGVILSELISLPETIRELQKPAQDSATAGSQRFLKKVLQKLRISESIGRDIFRKVIQKLHISDQFLPIRLLDHLYQPLARLGQHLDKHYLMPIETVRFIGPLLQKLLK